MKHSPHYSEKVSSKSLPLSICVFEDKKESAREKKTCGDIANFVEFEISMPHSAFWKYFADGTFKSNIKPVCER